MKWRVVKCKVHMSKRRGGEVSIEVLDADIWCARVEVIGVVGILAFGKTCSEGTDEKRLREWRCTQDALRRDILF